MLYVNARYCRVVERNVTFIMPAYPPSALFPRRDVSIASRRVARSKNRITPERLRDLARDSPLKLHGRNSKALPAHEHESPHTPAAPRCTYNSAEHIILLSVAFTTRSPSLARARLPFAILLSQEPRPFSRLPGVRTIDIRNFTSCSLVVC